MESKKTGRNGGGKGGRKEGGKEGGEEECRKVNSHVFISSN